MNIGENIVIARKNLNLTQADLADKMNVSYQAVSSWERDENLPLNVQYEIYNPETIVTTSNNTFTISIIPFISFPQKIFLTALTIGIPGIR